MAPRIVNFFEISTRKIINRPLDCVVLNYKLLLSSDNEQLAPFLGRVFGTIQGSYGIHGPPGVRLAVRIASRTKGTRRRVDTLVRIVIEVTGKYRGALSSLPKDMYIIYIYTWEAEDDRGEGRRQAEVLASKRGLNPRRASRLFEIGCSVVT